MLALSAAVTVETIVRKLFSVSLGGVDELSGYAIAIGAPLAFAVALIEHRRGDIRISRERRGREAAATPQPTLGPWARYLPSFDLAPARALARLLGAAEIPPPPLPEHNRRKA